MFIVPLFFTLTNSASAIECGEPVRTEEFERALGEAEQAFIEFNEIGFRDKVTELAGILLPCMKDALPKEAVARHHRVMAMHLLMVGDDEGSFTAVEAAKVADPGYKFPDTLLEAQHPLRMHYDGYIVEESTKKVPEPRSGSIAFDGEHTRRRSKIHPTVAQFFDEQGLALSTTYLGPREPLPAYRAVPRRRNTLILASASALVVSGSMYGLAWAQRGNLFASASNQELTAKTLDAKRARTNGLTFASGAFLGVAIGTGVGAALVGEQ